MTSPMFMLQLRKTRVTIPDTPTDDHTINTLDVGTYAQCGLLATDDENRARHYEDGDDVVTLNLDSVNGDNTATVHVDEGFKLNIEYNGSAILTFHIAVYENSEVNLPQTTFLRDANITMFGGTVNGIENVDVSLNGGFHLYPEARIYSDTRSVVNLNRIEVMDGGVFSYRGLAADEDALTLNVNTSFIVRGGGHVYCNKMTLTCKSSQTFIISVTVSWNNFLFRFKHRKYWLTWKVSSKRILEDSHPELVTELADVRLVVLVALVAHTVVLAEKEVTLRILEARTATRLRRPITEVAVH